MEGLKSEGNRPLGRCEHSLKDNIEMDLDEIGCGLYSCGSEERPVVGSCEHGSKPR